MANHLSALKRARQTKKRTEANQRHKSRLRHQIRALRRALQANDKAALTPLFQQTLSAIDRIAQKGLIKKNTAARYKSRLSHRVNALLASSAA